MLTMTNGASSCMEQQTAGPAGYEPKPRGIVSHKSKCFSKGAAKVMRMWRSIDLRRNASHAPAPNVLPKEGGVEGVGN